MENKGHQLELSTFKSWEKVKIKGCKMEYIDGKNFAKSVQMEEFSQHCFTTSNLCNCL